MAGKTDMILLLDTRESFCRLTLIDNDEVFETEWEAGRELSRGLLAYLESELGKHNKGFSDLTGIGAFKGPGSFTGLRIGLTVLNALADSLNIPIVGATGNDWKKEAISKLERGENERIVLPLYGGPAHITPPRK